MHKSTISAVTLLATAFCSMPAYLATSDSIFSAGLLSPSTNHTVSLPDTHYQQAGFGIGSAEGPERNAESLTYTADFDFESLANNTFFLSIHVSEPSSPEQKIKMQDSAWLPANLAGFSQSEYATTIYVDAFNWDNGQGSSETDLNRIQSFNFQWDTDPMAGKPLLVRGLKQYLALENQADFDFKVLRGRVINMSTDPLEYSIMNDLCFIKHCFF